MPTSTAERDDDGVPRNGFTLVEMMIVIAVAALLAGVVVLTVGNPGPGPNEAATRFASRIAAARDQAILSGRPISAWVSASGYGFDQLRDGRWEKLEQKPFEGDDWGPAMQVGLAGAGAHMARVRFDSLGVADQALAVRLARAGESAGVRIAANGEVTVE
jgi:general secretion pathway protein H